MSFADDTTILYSHKDINSKIELVNKELDDVTKWFTTTKLSVNTSKTNFMIMGTPHVTSTKTCEDLNVSLYNTALEKVKFTKFLVLIDECLTLKNHIDFILKTISRNIGVLNKLKHYISYRILHTLYCTLALRYLSYGILIWGKLANRILINLLNFKSGLKNHF